MVYGARPLKRVIQRYVQDMIADSILKGEIQEGSHVTVCRQGDGLCLQVESRT